MILIEEKNKYEFDDLFNSVIETEDKFLNKKLNSNICFGGKGGGGSKQQDIAPTLKPYVTDVLSRAKGEFEQPYQQYPGERIVGFTPQELAAQQGIQQMAGQYGLAATAPGLTSSAAYYTPAYGYLGQTGQALGQQAGALAEAPRLFGTQEALYGEALRPISGIQEQLTGAGALLGEAGMRQRAAARDIGRDEIGRFALTGEDIQQYMDPYQQAVIDIEKKQAQQDALQTAQAIAAKSAGAGAFGGSRQAILESQAASDLAKRLSDIQTRGSQAAYQQALQTAAQQQQVGLGQAAQQRAREQQLGAGLAGLAGARQQLGVGGYGNMAEQLRQAGAGFGGLGGQYGQLAGQYGQLGGGLGALSGQYGSLGQQALGQGYRELGYLSGVGEAQRGLGQQRADVAYQDFREAREFPTQQLERYAGMAFGVPSGYLSRPQATPSGFQQAVGGLATLGGLGQGLRFFKEGGDIGKVKNGLMTVYRQPGGTVSPQLYREGSRMVPITELSNQSLISMFGAEAEKEKERRGLKSSKQPQRDRSIPVGNEEKKKKQKEKLNELKGLLLTMDLNKNKKGAALIQKQIAELEEKLGTTTKPSTVPSSSAQSSSSKTIPVVEESDDSAKKPFIRSEDELVKLIRDASKVDAEALERAAKSQEGFALAGLGLELMGKPLEEVDASEALQKIGEARAAREGIPAAVKKAEAEGALSEIELRTALKELGTTDLVPEFQGIDTFIQNISGPVGKNLLTQLKGPELEEFKRQAQTEASAIVAARGIDSDSEQAIRIFKDLLEAKIKNMSPINPGSLSSDLPNAGGKAEDISKQLLLSNPNSTR